jgi:hypothetical protein
MNDTKVKYITAVFVNLRRPQLLVVFRRSAEYPWAHYDVFKPWDKIDAVYKVIEEFIREKPGFTSRLMDVDEKYFKSSSHRTRRYVHTDQSQLYPLGTNFAKKHSHKIGEIWIAKNLNTSVMLQLIRQACEAAEVDFKPFGAFKW